MIELNPLEANTKKTYLLIGVIFLFISILCSFLSDPSFGYSDDQISYNLIADDLKADLQQKPLLRVLSFFHISSTFSVFILFINKIPGRKNNRHSRLADRKQRGLFNYSELYW